MKLENRVTLITGAAGAGIGRGIARSFAAEGSKLIITDASAERSSSVADAIGREYGVPTLGIGCNVTIRNEVEAAVSHGIEKFGRIDVLVNNAGTNRPKTIVEMPDEAWELVINTSLRGTFYACRAVLPSMMEHHFGRIINISSTAAFMGLKAGHAHYAAAKAGVLAFTRCLAMEGAEHCITANAIAPGFIYNEFIPHLYPSEEIVRMEESIPYPRKGTPEDVGLTALFLATDGEYITGQTICVAGGAWMR
jgi:3-oxoacyl-[acyl-carrier protein] reductase